MRTLLLLLLLTPALLHAQSTETDLKARLLHQPLYLRGLWHDNNLHFDLAGHLLGASAPVSFTIAGIEISKLQLTATGLTLEGRRVGLEFKDYIPKRVGLSVGGPLITHAERMHLEIDASFTRDYTSALNAIFAFDLSDLVPMLPPWWKPYADQHLQPQLPGGKTATPAIPTGIAQVGKSILAPQVIKAPEPEFSQSARSQKYAGNSLIYLVVAATGEPGRSYILKPAGLGLDEMALAAVKQYQFKPATENGNPVAVEINVEVNFRIF